MKKVNIGVKKSTIHCEMNGRLKTTKIYKQLKLQNEKQCQKQ